MRTSLILSLLLLLTTFSAIHANVIDLTASNFDEKVLKSDGLWVVAFVAPWCGHCQRLKPEYVKAADALGGVVNVGTVNCDDEKELAGRYGIRGFPTIKVFKAGKENKGVPEDYQGARSAKAIVDYLMYIFNSLPDPVQTIADESALTSFAAADKTVALLVTSKPTTPALFKSIGIELGSKLKLGVVQDSKKDLTALLGVEKSPAVLVIKAGEGSIADRKIVYGGPLKKQELMTFFTKNAATAKPTSSSSSSAGDSSSSSTSTPTPAAEEVLAYKDPEEIHEQSQIDELCKQTCVIGVVRSPSDKDLVFNYAFQYRRQLKFGYIDPTKHASFLEQLGSTEGEGVELVVLRMGKKKYATSRVAEANAPMFFESVVYGGVRFKQLPSGFSLSKKNKDEL